MFGFACKVVVDGEFVDPEQYHTRCTTVTSLSKQDRLTKLSNIDAIVLHNLRAIKNLITAVSKLPNHLRMVRLPSDILPLFTHEVTSEYWSKPNLNQIADYLKGVGNIAKANGVRLSMHPAQMILISSNTESVVTRSVSELEYHSMLAEMLGYALTFQDFKCNIHVNGGGPEQFRKHWFKLSERTRRIITIENDEYTSGVDDCLTLSDLCPIVFDIHHDWIMHGQFRKRSDQKIDRIIESWKGIKPTMHVSTSRYSLASTKPLSKCSSPEKRSHSAYMWDPELNDIIAEYADSFDVMVEAKRKNKAARLLAEHCLK